MCAVFLNFYLSREVFILLSATPSLRLTMLATLPPTLQSLIVLGLEILDLVPARGCKEVINSQKWEVKLRNFENIPSFNGKI